MIKLVNASLSPFPFLHALLSSSIHKTILRKLSAQRVQFQRETAQPEETTQTSNSNKATRTKKETRDLAHAGDARKKNATACTCTCTDLFAIHDSAPHTRTSAIGLRSNRWTRWTRWNRILIRTARHTAGCAIVIEIERIDPFAIQDGAKAESEEIDKVHGVFEHSTREADDSDFDFLQIFKRGLLICLSSNLSFLYCCWALLFARKLFPAHAPG